VTPIVSYLDVVHSFLQIPASHFEVTNGSTIEELRTMIEREFRT
jgi:hypothetical protein